MKRNITCTMLYLVVGSAVSGLLMFPKEVSLAVKNSLVLCIDTLLPTLFPFLVVTGFLTKSGLAQQFGRPLERITGHIFRLPGACASALILGSIGGYPTGAKMAVELYRGGQCSRRETERLLAFCNNCGPGFLISSIGYGLLGSIPRGLLLYGIHLSAAVLVGIIFSPADRKSEHSSSEPTNRPETSLSSAFVESITEAMHGFINLSAFVLCFSAITCLIQISKIPQNLSFILPFSRRNAPNFLLGLLEMSCGVLHLGGENAAEQMLIISSLVGWGGLSVHCQVLSLMHDTDLSPAFYFKGKLLHTLLSALFTAALVGIIPPLFVALVLWAGAIVLYRRKKAVEKKRKVYYNAS